MKGLKRYLGVIIGMVMAIAVLPAMPAYASGKVVVAVSSSSLNIGDTVTVTATAQNDAGEQVSSTLGFQYDSSKLSFVSCSNSNYSGGEGGSVNVSAARASITLKATAAGSAAVSVSGSDGLTAGGTKLTVNDGTAASENQSGDNSLSYLKISQGTLSPAFHYKTTSYTVSVGSDVNEITVDAKASNAKAEVESITGNTNLKEGDNTISIVVKAENGSKAVYKIVVTKGGAADTQEDIPAEGTGEEDNGMITINGHEYNLSATIPADKVPENFTKTTISCKGQEVEALQFNAGNVVLVYLTTPDAEVKNTLAVYEQQSDIIYSFVKLEMGNGDYIILNPPADAELSHGYTASTVDLGEAGVVPAYGSQEAEYSDFYLIYAVSNTGTTGWYQYDKAEGTMQRYIQKEEGSNIDEEAVNADMKSLQNSYDKLDKQYTSERSFARKTIAVLVFAIAVLIVVIVNLILRGRKEEDEWEDDFNEIPKRFRKKTEKSEEIEDTQEVDTDLEDEWEEEKPKRKFWKKKEIKEEEEPEEQIPEQKKPERQAPEPQKPESEEDDFEVIDLDDL